MAICLIGVGRMGEPICSNLVRAGYQVRAYDTDPQRRPAVLASGAQFTVSAESAAIDADVLLTVLPGPAEVAKAVDDVVLRALAPGATWIDMSSSTKADAKPLRRRATSLGISVLEAPMGGSPADAAAGRLRLYVGGENAVLAQHRSLLSAVADRITHVGEHGAGYTATTGQPAVVRPGRCHRGSTPDCPRGWHRRGGHGRRSVFKSRFIGLHPRRSSIAVGRRRLPDQLRPPPHPRPAGCCHLPR